MSDPTAPLNANLARVQWWENEHRRDPNSAFNAGWDAALTALRAQQAQPVAQDWPEEAKARLDHALFGTTDKPAAWIRADGRLFATEAEAKFNPGYTAHALYLSPQAQTRREVVEECIAIVGRHQNGIGTLTFGRLQRELRALAPAIQQGKETK